MIKIITFLFGLFFVSLSFSQEPDKIYLKNKEIVSGKILRVTASNIEIDPVGDKPFLSIKRLDVSVLIYSDNTVVSFDDSSPDLVNKSSEREIPIKTLNTKEIENNYEKTQTISEKSEKQKRDEAYGVTSYIPKWMDPNSIVNYYKMEEPPLFPRCNGSSKKAHDCNEEKLKKHFKKHFKSRIAKTNRLESTRLGSKMGVKKNYGVSHARFIIDETGKVYFQFHYPKVNNDYNNEVERVISLLPNMKPGKVNGKPVNVSYIVSVGKYLFNGRY